MGSKKKTKVVIVKQYRHPVYSKAHYEPDVILSSMNEFEAMRNHQKELERQLVYGMAPSQFK